MEQETMKIYDPESKPNIHPESLPRDPELLDKIMAIIATKKMRTGEIPMISPDVSLYSKIAELFNKALEMGCSRKDTVKMIFYNPFIRALFSETVIEEAIQEVIQEVLEETETN